MPSRKNKNKQLLPILALTWILALFLAGGLIAASRMGVFEPASAAGLPVFPSTRTPLPPTWTPPPASAIPAGTALPAAGPDSGDHLAIEPTFTPRNPFPPTPTLFFTPAPPFEGPIVFGTSVGGRPLEVFRFGTGAVHRMIAAGIHGGYEWNTTRLADELIEHLQEHPDLVPRNVTLFIVRTLNPDGLARDTGFAGRVNDNGVDLNRNFPVNWAADWARARCWNFAPTSSGDSPGSEAETQALIKFITEETRVTALISYHSAALGIFPGGEPADEESVRLAEALAAVSTYPYPPIDIGCIYTGTLADWAASEGIAAVDLELHTHYFTDFEENLELLEAFLAWRR